MELENIISNIGTQIRVLKIIMIHQYKVELQERLNQGKEDNTFSRESVRENKKKFIENNMRRTKIKNMVLNTKLSKSYYLYIYIKPKLLKLSQFSTSSLFLKY